VRWRGILLRKIQKIKLPATKICQKNYVGLSHLHGIAQNAPL
jgi:hypothetical protein